MKCVNKDCRLEGEVRSDQWDMLKNKPHCANCGQPLVKSDPKPPKPRKGAAGRQSSPVAQVVPITQELPKPDEGEDDLEFDRRIAAAPESILKMMIAETTTGRHRLDDPERVAKVEAEIARREKRNVSVRQR